MRYNDLIGERVAVYPKEEHRSTYFLWLQGYDDKKFYFMDENNVFVREEFRESVTIAKARDKKR